MVEILNTELPSNKQLAKSLTKIYGINNSTAIKICNKIGLNQNKKVHEFNKDQLTYLKKYIEKVYKNKAGYALNKKIRLNIEMLITMRSYKGLRHKSRLPVRGQRTRSNGRTQKKVHGIGGGKYLSEL